MSSTKSFYANLICQNYCNLPLCNAPAPRTRWPVSRPPPPPPPPPPVKVWRQGRPLPPSRGRHAPPLPVPSPKLWYSGLLQQDRLRPKKSMHVQVLPSVELWWVMTDDTVVWSTDDLFLTFYIWPLNLASVTTDLARAPHHMWCNNNLEVFIKLKGWFISWTWWSRFQGLVAIDNL